MISYILDTEHVSLHQRGDELLKSRLLSVLPEQINITIISAEELIRGRLAQVKRAAKSDDRVKSYYWLFETLGYICSINILKYDSIAESYFHNLIAQKIRIGTQDLKIASIALSNKAILVTRNRKDFERVPDLRIEDWSTE